MKALQISEQLPLLVGTSVIVYLSTVLYALVYSAYFHPLKNFPGPFRARATSFPVAYHRMCGTLYTWISALHEEYGEVVRYVPDHLSYTDSMAWKDIFGHKRNGRGDMPKKPLMEVESRIIGGQDSIILMDAVDHTRTRRLLAHAFSDKAFHEQEPILNKYVQLLVGKIRDVTATPRDSKVDLMTWYTLTTFDIIADLSFGESFGMLRQGHYVPWISAVINGVHSGEKLSVLMHHFPALGWLVLKCVPRSMF